MGINAIYEYAATAIAGSNDGARDFVTYIAVGPSAPPIIPIDAASFTPHDILGTNALITNAPTNVKNTPNCAAAPNKMLFGLAISGPKSVIQPIPRNISGGYIPSLTPR